MLKKVMVTCLMVISLGLMTASTFGVMMNLSDPSGLSATAIFTLNGPTELEIVLINTSTDAPDYFDSSDQILTGISFNMGGINITGGSVEIGPDASDKSLNFSEVVSQLGQGDDVSSEWGYGNIGATGMLTNLVSANTSHVSPFSAMPNLDGPEGLDGPQGGIVANPAVVDIGGMGVIEDSIVITLNLSGALGDLSFLENGVIVEFGSDAAFVPEPATICLLGLGGLLLRRRRKV